MERWFCFKLIINLDEFLVGLEIILVVYLNVFLFDRVELLFY